MRILYIIPAGAFLLLAALCAGGGWVLRVASEVAARCESWALDMVIWCGMRSWP